MEWGSLVPTWAELVAALIAALLLLIVVKAIRAR